MTADAAQFLPQVQQRAGYEEERAARVSAGVLGALGDQVGAAAAGRLAAALPERFAVVLRNAAKAPLPGTMDDFYADVGRRADLPAADVPAAVSAVLRALAETVEEDALHSARPQLTAELQNLLVTDTSEGDTAIPGAGGPQDPDAPNLEGPDRPLH